MVSSVSSSDDNMQQLMAALYKKMSAADTDGTNGLSKSELSSVDAGDDVGGSAFLKSLSDQFDELDADGNGELSSEEIASAKPTGQMGPPPGLDLDVDTTDSTDSTSSTSSTDSSSSSISALLEKLIKEIEEKAKEAFEQNFKNTDSTSKSASATSNATKAESLISSADSDSSSSLSLDELKSIDTSSDTTGKAGFVNDLLKNFDSYDSDGDGTLSQSEIQAAMPKDPTTTAQNASSATDSSSVSSLFNGSLSNIASSSFLQKLISSYQNDGFSSLTSSLNIAS